MADEESNNGGCGEIVEVEGGHIVRSTGKKDRHSKVCTAKGPRDRRVRLSAPTAIQFYDVQDRLGFDRPSKAVDWLIKKAKSSIDDLAELPPWNPADTIRQAAANAKPKRSKTLLPPPATGTEHHHHHHHQQQQQSSYLPASMDSDSIADTMKSFFPVVSTEALPQHQPRGNTQSQSQDLRLSLQSTEHALFSGQSNPLGFDASTATSWDQSQEVGRMQRLVTWNNVGAGDSSGGFVFASPATTTSFQAGYGQQSQLFSQRGPLQSINTPMIRAWFDPHHHHHHHHHQSITTDDDLHNHHHHNHVPPVVHQSAIPGIAFASSGEFSGFRSIPARFQGEQEHHGDKPSSDSRH